MTRDGMISKNTVPSTKLTRYENDSSSSCSANSFDTNGLSVAKTLTWLRSQATNRSCADCRSVLTDPSTMYASICFVQRNEVRRQSSSRKIALQDFRLTHRAFAPPNSTFIAQDGTSAVRINEYDDDPAFSVNQRFGGHGVIICGRCAEAHRRLGLKFKVKRVIDTSTWTMEEAHFIGNCGGNAQCWKIYEAFVPDKWKQRRPVNASSLSVRMLFCKAKYEALAFCLPLPGPLAKNSWKIVLRYQQEKRNKLVGSANLKNISSLSLVASRYNLHEKNNDDFGSPSQRKKYGLPNRLVDYFCVVSSSMQFLPSKTGKKKKEKKANYSNISSPESLDFWPHISDCYPPENTHGEMAYKDHVSSFIMPGGCRPTLHPKPPSFSTFVLTMADGTFVYGGTLKIYDEHVDAEEIKIAMRDSGYEGAFPKFLMKDDQTTNDSDVFFFPKCLVFLSRYAFFNLFRSALLEIYQISLIAAPLPIERYISNFVREVPLPPQGQVKVEFAFTTDKTFSIERPAINELPMADFSFRPLFASLSVSNIIVVLGYLLQESQVVLLSKHYSLLTPIAEALLSAIFPFRWVGLYIPIAPLKMMDVLEAPVPYLIGLSSEYFSMVDVRQRPKDAIFVDLDRDVIYIGDVPLPKMPEQDTQKLTSSLEEAGGSVYVIPNSGIKGCIMAGSKKALLVPNENRPRYAHMTTMTGLEINSFLREELFSKSDLAYGLCDEEAERINCFESVDGQLTSKEETTETNGKKKGRPLIGSPIKMKIIGSPIKKPQFARKKKADILSRSQSAMSQGHLLDMTEPERFSVVGIRNAFLRFVVATFAEYQDSLLENSGHDLFDEEKFVEDVGSRGRSMIFLKKVLKTQLFHRFLEERKENPDLPEIRFFDESIVAKRNRSKKTNLVIGGKKPTPFLDDRSTWKVKKVFTCPPPNNFGIPDTEVTYRHETFPVLDDTRFGRIRHPVTWPQHTNLDSVRYTKKFNSKMKKTQNEIVKNAMIPFLAAPNTIAAAARRAAKDLESTLVALSIVPSAKHQENMVESTSEGEILRPSSRRNVKTLSTADTIMMDARRKQCILLDVIIEIQAICRGHLARLDYCKYKGILLECKTSKEKVEWETQEAIRRELARKHWQLRNRGAIRIQSFVRMLLVQKRTERIVRSIIAIQSSHRARSERQRWKRLKYSAVVIAKSIKGRRTKIIYQELRRMIAIIQSIVRGGLVRSRMKLMMNEKMTAYTNQIFVLWKHLHVSLVFRTKLWPEITGSKSFICLCLAELELLRLWDIASLSDRLNGAECIDEIALYCSTIGLSNDIYCKSKRCADWIQSGGCIVSKIDNSSRIEETERLQIYERLSLSGNEKDLTTLYSAFDVLPDEKLKKVALSQKFWTALPLANCSASSMHHIFPELKNSLSMNILKPSSKGKRRFRNVLKVAVPAIDRELWEEISIQGKTKRHVQEVAMLFITKVPSLMNKLDSINYPSKSDAHCFLQAAMEVHGFESIEQARCSIIMQYLGRKCGKIVKGI